MKLDTSEIVSGSLKYTEYVCTAEQKEFQTILDCVRGDLVQSRNALQHLVDTWLGPLKAKKEVFHALLYRHVQDIESQLSQRLNDWRNLPWWKRAVTREPSRYVKVYPRVPLQAELDAATKEQSRLMSRISEAEMVVANIVDAIKKNKTCVVWVTNDKIPLAFETTKEFHS